MIFSCGLPRLGQKGLRSVDLLKLVLQLLCPSLLESTLNRKEAYLLPFGCTFPESAKESPHFYNIQPHEHSFVAG